MLHLRHLSELILALKQLKISSLFPLSPFECVDNPRELFIYLLKQSSIRLFGDSTQSEIVSNDKQSSWLHVHSSRRHTSNHPESLIPVQNEKTNRNAKLQPLRPATLPDLSQLIKKVRGACVPKLVASAIASSMLTLASQLRSHSPLQPD